MSAFEKLAEFDGGYDPTANAFSPGLETLEDGEYDFTITEAVLKESKHQGLPIFELHLRVPQTGAILVHGIVLNNQVGVNILGAGLYSLGFDELAKGKPFSAGLKSVIPKLREVSFRGKKEENADALGRVHANLRFLARIDSMPVPFALTALTPTPAAHKKALDSSIPF